MQLAQEGVYRLAQRVQAQQPHSAAAPSVTHRNGCGSHPHRSSDRLPQRQSRAGNTLWSFSWSPSQAVSYSAGYSFSGTDRGTLGEKTGERDTIWNVSYTNSSPGRRGRPRDAQLELRITTTVLEVLGEEGYDGVSFEAVARRCRTSKASLYRRWASKRDMVIAAVKAGPTQHSTSPLRYGVNLREDLLILCRRLQRMMAAADSGTALMLLQAGLEDPELCEAIEDSVGPTGARLPQSVIDAAVARGELPAGASPFAFEEVVGSVLLLRRTNGLQADDNYLAALVDTVIIPALVSSADSATTLPAGIFSGHPEGRSADHTQENS